MNELRTAGSHLKLMERQAAIRSLPVSPDERRDDVCAVEDPLTGRCEDHTLPDAAEELHSELVFNFPELVAQRGL